MAVLMDTEVMNGEFLASPGNNVLGPRLYDSGPKAVAPGLRGYSTLMRKAAACGVEVGSCEWQLEPLSDLSSISPGRGSVGVQEQRTWRALEPTVIGNRVQWTCTVAPTTPKSSEVSTPHFSPSDDSAGGGGVQDNTSDHSFTSTLTNEDNVSAVMPPDLVDSFHSSAALHDHVRSLLDVPGPLGSGDGYSEFELLSSQFPMISPDFEANEDSNSCGSGSSENGNQWSAAENRCSTVDEIIPPGCIKFEPKMEALQDHEEERDRLSPMLFAEQMQQQMSDSAGLLAGGPGAGDDDSDGSQYKEERGVELVQQLLACARAIANGELLPAQQHVERLSQLMCPKGSPMERVATYFTEALAAWVGGPEQPGFIVNDSDVEYMEYSALEQSWIAYQVFYASCPYLIITHFTANQAILEAFEGEEKVHVVDLDIKQGLQWPSLIQALSERAGGPPQLRITGVAGASPDLPSMMATRNRLLEFADMFSVPLEFTILTENVEDLQPWMLGIRDHEVLAVNCVTSLHQLVDHPRRPLRSFLQMLHGLEPSVVTIVEQDANHDQDFFPRFMDALHYYSSMFDSLAASLSSSLVERELVERLLLGKDIMSIVGRRDSGEDRYGRHQTADVWMQHMSEVGFNLSPLSPHSTLQAEYLLSMYPISKYCLFNEDGYLSLGWQDNPLYCVSCWC